MSHLGHGDHLQRKIRISRYIAFFVLSIVILIYFIWFFIINKQEIGNPSDWGQFGDYVGGILNPLMAFLAFYWLTVSVEIQKTELSETRVSLRDASESQAKQSKSQEAQVKISIQTAKINAASIQLNAINTKLASLYQQRLSITNRAIPYVTDDRGNVKQGYDLLEEVNKDIEEQERAQTNLMAYVTELMNVNALDNNV